MSPEEIIDACAAGRLAPPIALMHVIGASPEEADFALALAQARNLAKSSEPVAALCELADRNPDCWRLAHDMLATVKHDAAASIEQLAAMFDDAVSLSPAASVALYSLGDESALEGATRDVIGLMEAAGLLGGDRDLLDLGCGIGRIAHALSGRVRHVTGVDISHGMIAEARRRCDHLPNVRLEAASGRDLAMLETASMDVILAADVFPYLVQVGLDLAAAHVREAARVLRPGGAMLILNFSYRGDGDQDARDLAEMAARAGLAQAELAPFPMSHWDASPFLLRKPA